MVTNDTYHHGDLERALIEAGLDLLEEGGSKAVGLRSAARRVGVSHAAPGRHFPNAGSFLAALAADGYRQLTDDMKRAVADHADDPVEAFRQVGLAYIRSAVNRPELFKLQFHPLLAGNKAHARLVSSSEEAFGCLRRALSAARGSGALRTDMAVDDLAVAAWSTVHGIATLLVDDQLAHKGLPTDAETWAETVTTVLFLGLSQ